MNFKTKTVLVLSTLALSAPRCSAQTAFLYRSNKSF